MATEEAEGLRTREEYRSRLARMQAGAGELTLKASIAKAKTWIADEKWLPTPDLKEVLRRLVEAVEAPSGGPVLPPAPETLNPSKTAAHQTEPRNVTPEKPSAKRGRPRKVF